MSQGCAACVSDTVHTIRSWSPSGRVRATQPSPERWSPVSGVSLGSSSIAQPDGPAVAVWAAAGKGCGQSMTALRLVSMRAVRRALRMSLTPHRRGVTEAPDCSDGWRAQEGWSPSRACLPGDRSRCWPVEGRLGIIGKYIPEACRSATIRGPTRSSVPRSTASAGRQQVDPVGDAGSACASEQCSEGTEGPSRRTQIGTPPNGEEAHVHHGDRAHTPAQAFE